MKFVILAGGLGTRLRPYTFIVPKPLLPIGKSTLLEHTMAHLRTFDPTEVILSIGYQSQLIRAYCQHAESFHLPLSFVEEEKPLGTAGCLALLRDRLRSEDAFFLMNGDIVTKLDFRRMAEAHRVANADVTVGIVMHEYQSPFGVLELEGRRLISVTEKPVLRQPVSAGIYCISASVLDRIPDNTFTTMPEVMMSLVREKKTVMTHEIKEYWRAIETQDHFAELQQDGMMDDGV
jgi:NDP-sugar pyrophosphorylase family protein